MIVEFHKMQALGNDFVIIEHRYSEGSKKLFEKEFLTRISNRLYGVGCDQVVIFYRENCFIHASFFNNDGNKAEICGNASRCLGKLMKKVYGISKFPMIAAGKDYEVQVNGDDSVSVNMGLPSLESNLIGLSREVKNPFDLSIKDNLKIKEDFFSDIQVSKIACVSVGNPHLVIFTEHPTPLETVVTLGQKLSTNDLFSNEINVSFAIVISENKIEQCTFERGTGLTLACGSGACATAFLASKCGFTKSAKIIVMQRGGSLFIDFNENGSILQTGSAFYVFSGKIEL